MASKPNVYIRGHHIFGHNWMTTSSLVLMVSCLAFMLTASIMTELCCFCKGYKAKNWNLLGNRRIAIAAMNRDSALQILGIEQADLHKVDAIKRAFYREVQKVHPDKPSGDPARFQQVKEAYELLHGRNEVNAQTSARTSKSARPSWAGGASSTATAPHSDVVKPRPSVDTWVPEDGPPTELHEVWSQIGFNPYTGDYYRAPGWQPEDPRAYAKAHGEPVAPRWSDADESPADVAHSPARASQQPPSGASSHTASSSLSSRPQHAWFSIVCLTVLVSGIISTPHLSGSNSHGVVQSQTVGTDTSVFKAGSDSALTAPGISVQTFSYFREHGNEYALAAAAAKMDQVPLLLNTISPSADAIRDWLATSTTTAFQELPWSKFPDDYFFKQWEYQGAHERIRLLADTMRAALDEPHNANSLMQVRFHSMTAIVNEDDMQDLVGTLQSSEPSDFFTSHAEHLSNREVVKLKRVTTGQELLLVGARHNVRDSLVIDHSNETPAAMMQLQELHQAIQQAKSEIVLLDMSDATWHEHKDEFSALTRTDLCSGIEILDPIDLESLKPPVLKSAPRGPEWFVP